MADPIEPADRDSSTYTAADPYLVVLVNTVNAMNGAFGIGVSLTVGGSVVSGLLIDPGTYFTQIQARLMASSSDNEAPIAQVLGEQYGQIADSFRKDAKADAGEDAQRSSPARYIHLREALIWSPGLENPLRMGLWRGRLSQISGWVLGNATG